MVELDTVQPVLAVFVVGEDGGKCRRPSPSSPTREDSASVIYTLAFAALDIGCAVIIQFVLLRTILSPNETLFLRTAEQQGRGKPDTRDGPDDENDIHDASQRLLFFLRRAHHAPPLFVCVVYDLIVLHSSPPFFQYRTAAGDATPLQVL